MDRHFIRAQRCKLTLCASRLLLITDTGPYSDAVLRFEISFTPSFPSAMPSVRVISDIFHPLVAPLTTQMHITSAPGPGTAIADDNVLPSGGLNLEHGFPEYFATSLPLRRSPHVVLILQYVRAIFDSESVLDSVPLTAAGNPGAWHAWRSYRSKTLPYRPASSLRQANTPEDTVRERSASPRQQPGGARKPGEWNWLGVWESRVRKCVQATISDTALFGASEDQIVSLKHCRCSREWSGISFDSQINFRDVDSSALSTMKSEIFSTLHS